MGNYDDQYTKWTILRQERDQTVSEYTNNFHTLRTKLSIKDSERYLILQYRSGIHQYIRTEMDFLDISSLGSAYRYVVKIEEKFRQKNKRDSGPAHPPQNQGKGNPGPQNTGQGKDNQSLPQAKKGDGKTKKDTGKWCEFHKSPWHNTAECRSKQSLVAEIKSSESDPDSDFEPNATTAYNGREIIDVDPTSTIATTQIQLEDPEESEAEERLFHSQTWVKRIPLHFFVDNNNQKNMVWT